MQGHLHLLTSRLAPGISTSIKHVELSGKNISVILLCKYFVSVRRIGGVHLRAAHTAAARSTHHETAPRNMNAICGRVAPCWSSSKTRTSVGGAGLKRAVAGGRRLGNNTHGGRAKKLEVRAGENPESSVSMDYKGALKFLGLSENASSEDMVRAKNQMLSRYEDQEEKLKTVRVRVGGRGLVSERGIDPAMKNVFLSFSVRAWVRKKQPSYFIGVER